MRRPAIAERVCHHCPFRASSGGCLDRRTKSGRCGDWVWFVRYRKQFRRLYVRPHDPRTPAQLRSRARLSAASAKYSCFVTEKERHACIAAGARLRTRRRLFQFGPLTGQQYSIRRQYALERAHGRGIKTAIAPQVLLRQEVKRTTWERFQTATRVAPGLNRPRPRHASLADGVVKKAHRAQVPQRQRPATRRQGTQASF